MSLLSNIVAEIHDLEVLRMIVGDTAKEVANAVIQVR
jgi:hypothetical protein